MGLAAQLLVASQAAKQLAAKEQEQQELEAKIAQAKRKAEELAKANDQFDDFKGQLSGVLRRNFSVGCLKLDWQSHTHKIPDLHLYLEYIPDKIRSWLLDEGFNVAFESRTQIGESCDYDHEGGSIRGSERTIYGPQFTIEWET